MEMLIIPAISLNLEQTGISRSKHFPCKALFILETNINTKRGFSINNTGRFEVKGSRNLLYIWCPGHLLFLSRPGVGGHFRVAPSD